MPLASTNVGRVVTARSLNLHNVDNTPDSQKPVSQVQQVVINSTDAAADAAQARADAAHNTLATHAVDISAAQTSANGAQSTANGAVTAANGAQSTANGAVTAASTAQSTANGAQTAANSAQSTANGAASAASAAQTTANGALTAVPSATTAAIALNTAKVSCPTWVPAADPSYLTAVPSATVDAIAANTTKVTFPGHVKSNWNETDASSDAFIQNKPSIPSAYNELARLGNTDASLGAITVGTAAVNLKAGAKLNGNAIVTTTADTDLSHELGRAKIGYIGHNDIAAFSHYDKANTTDYALLQSAQGSTIINAPTGKTVRISVGGVENGIVYNGTTLQMTNKTITDCGSIACGSIACGSGSITCGSIVSSGSIQCGSVACTTLSQSTPYYLNLGYNVGGGVHSITHSSPELIRLYVNTSRNHVSTTDFSTTGTDAYWWCPSQTGIYLVCCRATFRASNQDYLVEATTALAKKNTSIASGYEILASANERNWGSSTNSQRDDRDFSKSPSVTTIVRVMTTTEKYRMYVSARTYNGVTPWIMKSMDATGMEVTKLA